jgi:periplasmic divalent cation tolerance protein
MVPDPEGLRVVLMTSPDAATAERVVTALVEERLAACGNIVPAVTSIFRWEGDVQRETEVLVVMKTTAAQAPALLKRAQELHPYEVPELLSLQVDAGCEPYIAWVMQSTGREQD